MCDVSKMVNMLPEASVEENIVLALARAKNPLTYYQLWKKHKVAASNKTVLVALKRLDDSYHAIESRREHTGRRRKFYHLTFFGLLATLTYGKAWQLIDEIAKAREEMLPLIFGKWSFFRKEHILDEIIERLRAGTFLLWKSSASYFILPETLSKFLEIRKMSTRQRLASMPYSTYVRSVDERIRKYIGEKRHLLRADLTSMVLGIYDLPWIPVDYSLAKAQKKYPELSKEEVRKLKLKVGKQRKLLQVLGRDPDLRNYLSRRLGLESAILDVQKENVESWRRWVRKRTN